MMFSWVVRGSKISWGVVSHMLLDVAGIRACVDLEELSMGFFERENKVLEFQHLKGD